MKKMKKLFHYAYVVALAMMMTAGITSCTDDDNDGGEAQEIEDLKQEEMKSLTEKYVNDVVYPTYDQLAGATESLYGKIEAMRNGLAAGTLTQSQIDDVCKTFLEARAWWEKSEAWLYGPAENWGIDPHIDTWPLSRNGLATFLRDNRSSIFAPGFDVEEAIEAVSSNNNEDSWLGFHGLEFVLFRDGANRTVADFEGEETASEFAGTGVDGALELDFALAVAGDLRDHCYWLQVAWNEDAPQARRDRVAARGWTLTDNNGYYTGYALTNPASGMPYTSRRNAVSTIINAGCMNIAQEVADQKMGQVWRCATGNAVTGGEEPDSPDYIESPYSHKSFQDFYDNIVSIKNALYGNIDAATYDGSSIMAYLNKHNPDLAASIQSGLDASFSALDVCLQGRAFVEIAYGGTDAELKNVENAMNAINSLNEALAEADDWITKN